MLIGGNRADQDTTFIFIFHSAPGFPCSVVVLDVIETYNRETLQLHSRVVLDHGRT